MRKYALVILLLLITFTHTPAQPAESRPFLLGFTPFPYEVSNEAVAYTYERISQDADLIVHHFDSGVPWTEALAGERYNINIINDWTFRRRSVPEAHQLMVTVTPIRLLRDGLALYRGEAEDLPIPAPFDSYHFDHPDVIAAFIHYCDSIITFFQPDYFLFGIEVNLLMKNAPDQWDSYMVLHREVYAHLKATYPDLPAFVSLTGIDLIDGYTDANHADQARALADVLPHTDIVGLSIYPYMTGYLTNAIPTDLIDQLAALTEQPIAITETGYPAQDFAIVNGLLRIQFDSDEDKQAAWVRHVLDKAAEYEFEMVVNFVLRDYDALWRYIGAREDLTIAWRDTGLYSEDGSTRPALDIWREWLALPYAG
jgi:hypothetical protein